MKKIEEAFVSFNQAKRLKELGFPQEIPENELQVYYSDGALVYLCDAYDYEDNHDVDEMYRCPNLSLAQKWLREERNIHIVVNTYAGGLLAEKNNIWIPMIYQIEPIKWVRTKETYYPSYEDALSAGFDKVLSKDFSVE